MLPLIMIRWPWLSIMGDLVKKQLEARLLFGYITDFVLLVNIRIIFFPAELLTSENFTDFPKSN